MITGIDTGLHSYFNKEYWQVNGEARLSIKIV
jgi:hypothetical protein